MIRNRISRITASLGLALSLSLSLVALPAIVLGALPDVTTGYGTNSDASPAPTNGAVPTVVGPSEPVLVQVWAKNSDTSNISQFYLAITSSGTLVSATWAKSSGESDTCAAAGTYDCAFGQLRPGVTVYISALFTAPASAGPMANSFEFSTTGLGSGPDSDNSHGDTWVVSNPVTVNGTGDFGGRYVTTSSLTTVQNGQSLGPTNKQSTIVYSPETGIGVTVEDGPGVSGGCASGVTCFSETSQINVNNGAAYPGGFKVVVNLHNSQIPSGVNANNLVVYHDGEQITDKCGKTPDPDCYSVKKFSWGLQVTIWLDKNGNIKFA